MSKIKVFRINGYDRNVLKDSVEIFVKIVGADDKILCSFALGDDGLYYYRLGAHILTPNENDSTRDSYDGFLSMENLKDIFEGLIAAKISEDSELEISRKGKLIQIAESKKIEK